LNQYSAVYDDAVSSTLELLQADKRFTYIADIRTKMVRIDYPNWRHEEFDDAVARLVTYLMPHLYPSLPFKPRELQQEEYQAFWEGLAEHLLVTVE
jgi:hypothetical protein